MVSSTLAGATVGSFTGGALADNLGRKRTFQINAVPLIVGTLLRFVIILFFYVISYLRFRISCSCDNFFVRSCHN